MNVYEIMGLTKEEYERELAVAANRHPEYGMAVRRAMALAIQIREYCGGKD